MLCDFCSYELKNRYENSGGMNTIKDQHAVSLEKDMYYLAEAISHLPSGETNTHVQLNQPRVIYDRVLYKKNNFEIPAFFMFERGKSRAGKFKPMLNYSRNYFILNFPFLAFLVQT